MILSSVHTYVVNDKPRAVLVYCGNLCSERQTAGGACRLFTLM